MKKLQVEGWKVEKLSDVCENLDSQRIPVTQRDRKSGDYPYYGASGIVDYVDKYIFDGDFLLVSEDGANLLARTYPIAFSISGKTWVNNHAHVLRFASLITQRFVEYYLNSISLEKYVNGMAQPKLNQAMLNSIPIPIPPLPEQQRIVTLLDETFAGLVQVHANAERNLVNAREVFELVAREVFENRGDDWNVNKIQEVCELKSGTTISTSLEREKGDVLYVKVGDMNLPENLVEIHTSSRFVKSDEINQNQIIPEGAIIFPKRGGAIATNKKRKIIKPTIVDLNTMAIIPSEKIDKDFLYHWFQLFDLKTISNGANVPQINNYSFDDVYIYYPKSLEEQRAIVERLDALAAETSRLEAVYQSKLEAVEELRKSVLGKAFEGSL